MELFMVNKVVDKAVDTDKSQNTNTIRISASKKLTQKNRINMLKTIVKP